MKKQIEVYNLEFPPYIEELNIGDYKFKRVSSYERSFDGLMHLANRTGSEFDTKIQTGSHQITAIIETPEQEKASILPWADRSTQLDDVLFLLTLFTGRNVFQKNWDGEEEKIALVQDHRLHYYGGQLILSIKYESMWKHKGTAELKTAEEIKNIPVFDYHQINIGFEKSINKALQIISSKEWQYEYEGGYFLFLFRSAIQRQIIETSFLLCWVIWEHIFAIRNRKWLDDKTIEQMEGDKKISFILNKYFLKEIDEVARRNIRRINRTRNRLVHFGKKTEDVDLEEMEMFIRLTEQLMAIVLGLAPSNAFNSFESLDDFLIKN